MGRQNKVPSGLEEEGALLVMVLPSGRAAMVGNCREYWARFTWATRSQVTGDEGEQVTQCS